MIALTWYFSSLTISLNCLGVRQYAYVWKYGLSGSSSAALYTTTVAWIASALVFQLGRLFMY